MSTSLCRNVVRANIILLAAYGHDKDDVTARLDTHGAIVSKWRKRSSEEAVAGLEESPGVVGPRSFLPRGGRPSLDTSP